MWVYEKRLQYPVNITQTNAKLAQVIISQFGGPDGELAASQRYLSQRYTMPDGMTKGLLNDIGTEEYSRQLLRLSVDILPYIILHTIQCPPADLVDLQSQPISALAGTFLLPALFSCPALWPCLSPPSFVGFGKTKSSPEGLPLNIISI